MPPATMKAIRIAGPGQAVWADADLPALPATEVLVRVEAVTTCPQWDLHLLAGEPMFPGIALEYPFPAGQPGHEMAGEVVQVGAEVTDLQLGDRVAAWRDPGKLRTGCYAQYVPFDPGHLLKVPASLSLTQVVSLELAMCVQVSCNQLNAFQAIADRRVAVSGLGPAGLIAVQMARIYGARNILALDPLPMRRQLALELGADQALDPGAHEVAAMGSWDTGMDCTGLVLSVRTLLSLCTKFVHVFGVLREDVAFGFAQWRKGLALVGYGTHSRAAAEQALAHVAAGQLALEPLATHTLPLRDYLQGIHLLQDRQAVKICYRPWT